MFCFLRSASSAPSVETGSEQHLDELLRELLRERPVHLAVQDDDAAVRRGRVGGERLVVRLVRRRADRDAAGIRVLHDHAARQRELTREQPRGREVVEVVERQPLAVHLLDAREQVPAGAAVGVVRGALVRVLAVREVEHLLEREHERRRERLGLGEPGGDRRLVRRGRRERLGCELPPRLERERAVPAELVEHEAVLVGPADRGDVREVLRGAAQHRRAADVDHLDRLLLGDAASRRDVGERIEVDADEVERLDPELLERRDVRRRRRAARGSPRGSADAASSRGRRASPASPSASRRARRRARARSRYAAVPPLATSSQPSSASPRASTSSPVLSYVEISARTVPSPPPGAAGARRS